MPNQCALGRANGLECLAELMTDEQAQRLHSMLMPLARPFKEAEERAKARDPVLESLHVVGTVQPLEIYLTLYARSRPTLIGGSSGSELVPNAQLPMTRVGREVVPAENAGAELLRFAESARITGRGRAVDRGLDGIHLLVMGAVPARIAESLYKRSHMHRQWLSLPQINLSGLRTVSPSPILRVARIVSAGSFVGIAIIAADGAYMLVSDDSQGLLGRAWELAVWTATVRSAQARTLREYYKNEGFQNFMALPLDQRAAWEARDPELRTLREVQEDVVRRLQGSPQSR